MEKFDTETMATVSTKRVSCNGGDDQLGHPLIYLEIGEDNEITCPYCGKKFIYSESN